MWNGCMTLSAVLFIFIKIITMDLQAEKIRLIEWIAGLNDAITLQEFIDLKKQKEEDWWDRISEQERAEILEGLSEASKGEVIPHDQVMAKCKQWL